MQFTLIGNPENRRCQYFIAALKSQGFAPPFVVAYLDILQKKVDLVDLNNVLKQTDYLRLESPGENFEVARHLLMWGAKHPDIAQAEHISAQEAEQLSLQKGEIRFLRQTHLGFLELLRYIQEQVQQQPQVQLVNSIAGIQLCFDKIACHQHFVQHNISVPPAIYTINNYEDLRTQMKAKGWNRVFIKPVYGSSASGVIAYRINNK